MNDYENEREVCYGSFRRGWVLCSAILFNILIALFFARMLIKFFLFD